MKLLQCGILISLASSVVAPLSVAAQTITNTTAAPGVTPANVTTDVKFSATVTGHPALVVLNYLNGPAGHPVVVGQLRRKECRDHDHDDDHDRGDGDRDRHCRNPDRYTLSKRFNFPAGHAQFQISATGSQGQVLSPVIPVLSLGTPPGFAINSGSTKHGGPLSFNNFNNKYISGGFLPENGADITITYEPLEPPLGNLIDIELNGADIKTRTSVNVSGVTCTRIFYTEDDFSPVWKVVAIYCPSGKQLYKFFLDYTTGDPNENQYLSSFQQVVTNAQIAP